MENKQIKIVDRVRKEAQVDEKAFLVLSPMHIGVTNELGDVIEFLRRCQDKRIPIQIIPGYREELLELQQRILLMDEVRNSIGANRLTTPKQMDDYNLIERIDIVPNKFTELSRGAML